MNGAAIHKLNLPEFEFRTENRNGLLFIFDEFRGKWIRLTPEEWVRQNFIRYLTEHKGFPGPLIALEKRVDINGLSQRFDLLVYNRRGAPLLVAEFKSPAIRVSQLAFDQAVRYNSELKAPYVVVSNGLAHYVCHIDFTEGKAVYLSEVPDFAGLTEAD
ncbi:MAG: type I restriction enzyme HsdR N-terminal domain-containing protein [Bacteroidota bacterium]